MFQGVGEFQVMTTLKIHVPTIPRGWGGGGYNWLLHNCPMWSVEQNIGQVEKGVFYKILAFLVMSLTKILETFKRFFPSSFNRKYVHTVACTVVFRADKCCRLCRTRAFCAQRLSGPQCYLSSFQLFKQNQWSRGRFNRFLPLLVKDPFV